MYPESSIADQSQMPPVTRAPMAGAPGYTMSPPNGGYPRPGATHPQGYIQPYTPPGHPGYPYPPNPLASQPNGYPYPYPAPGPLPPIGATGPYPGPHYSPQQQPVASPPPPPPPPPPPQQLQQQQQPLPSQQQHQAPLPFEQRLQRPSETHLPHPPPMPPYSHVPPTSSGPGYLPTQQAQFAQPAAVRRSPPPQQATAAQALLID